MKPAILNSPHRHRIIHRRVGLISPTALRKMEQGTDSVYISEMAVLCQNVLSSRVNAGLLVGLLLYLGSNTAFSQAQPPLIEKFEADAPRVGAALPDITIHDDLGNPVNIRELANENYKVLILGCLT